MRREGVRKLKMESERGTEDKRGTQLKMPAGTNTFRSLFPALLRAGSGAVCSWLRTTELVPET